MISRNAVPILVALFGLARTAAPQDAPKAEISLGYAYLYDDTLADEEDIGGSFPLGWMASANFNVNHWLGVVVDVTGSYKSSEVLFLDAGTHDMNLDVYGFHGGLRLSSYRNPRVTPYFQALAGVTRGSVKFEGESESESDFSIQPGAGVTIMLSDSVGLDIGADYRLVFGDEENTNEFRAHAGLVFRIGR